MKTIFPTRTLTLLAVLLGSLLLVGSLYFSNDAWGLKTTDGHPKGNHTPEHPLPPEPPELPVDPVDAYCPNAIAGGYAVVTSTVSCAEANLQSLTQAVDFCLASLPSCQDVNPFTPLICHDGAVTFDIDLLECIETCDPWTNCSVYTSTAAVSCTRHCST